MKNQRQIAVLLISGFIFVFVAAYISLSAIKSSVRHEVKEEIKAGLDLEDLTLLTFKNTDLSGLEWEHEKEFKFQGNMYDVVKREIIGDSTQLWCWLDSKETLINENFSKLFLLALGDSNPFQDQEKSAEIFKLNLHFQHVEKKASFEESKGVIRLLKEHKSSIHLKGMFRPPIVLVIT